jgi:bacterioferritin-associated ferredoxin
MYVCLCHSVTEQQIVNAIADGARCMRDLSSSLHITKTCGRCANCAKEHLQRSMSSGSHASACCEGEALS